MNLSQRGGTKKLAAASWLGHGFTMGLFICCQGGGFCGRRCSRSVQQISGRKIVEDRQGKKNAPKKEG